MTIEAIRTGKFGKGINYVIRADNGSQLASFPTLEKAALVLRYLLGMSMDESDLLSAVVSIREYDEKKRGCSL